MHFPAMWERNLRFVTALIPNLIIVKKNGTLARPQGAHTSSVSVYGQNIKKCMEEY